MSKQLNGKIALVTGGSSGIGLAAARELVEQGARVFITGRRQAELDAAVARWALPRRESVPMPRYCPTSIRSTPGSP